MLAKTAKRVEAIGALLVVGSFALMIVPFAIPPIARQIPEDVTPWYVVSLFGAAAAGVIVFAAGRFLRSQA